MRAFRPAAYRFFLCMLAPLLLVPAAHCQPPEIELGPPIVIINGQRVNADTGEPIDPVAPEEPTQPATEEAPAEEPDAQAELAEDADEPDQADADESEEAQAESERGYTTEYVRVGNRKRWVRRPIDKPEPSLPPIELPAPTAIPGSMPLNFSEPSDNVIVGKIVHVNNERMFAVAYLETRFLSLPKAVISRNHELQVTGIFEPVEINNGRAFGLRILTGSPLAGNEVVIPGPDYSELIETAKAAFPTETSE